MKLSDKVQTALGETRILILGAQILLGFELRGVFSESYDLLPAHARYLDAAALGFMVFAVGLLIAPGPYHRIAQRGRDSGQFHHLITVIADLALLPFAFALGIDVFITAERVFDKPEGVSAATVAVLLALGLWYGFPRLRRRSAGQEERSITRRQKNEVTSTPLHSKIEHMLTEARVILPGAQALLGFQLSIVLTQSFEKLPNVSKTMHATSLFFVALAIMMLIAPAAYHRIVYLGEDSEDMHRVGSTLITAATVPLALGLAGDVYVVIAKIAESARAGALAAALVLVLLVGLWHAYPLAIAVIRSGRARG